MFSVTAWIKKDFKLPRNFWNSKEIVEVKELKDLENLNSQESEILNPSSVGVIVDYLSRLAISNNFSKSFITIEEAFRLMKSSPSLEANRFMEEYGFKIEKEFKSLKNMDVNWREQIFKNDKLIEFTAILTIPDTYFRCGVIVSPKGKRLDKKTIHNIKVLVKRVVNFLETKEGGIICGDHITALTTKISSGDWDFLSKKALVDIKVIKTKSIEQKYWIQLLVYFLLAQEAKDFRFKEVEKLTIFNPRYNTTYTIKIRDIPKEVIDQIKEQWGEVTQTLSEQGIRSRCNCVWI